MTAICATWERASHADDRSRGDVCQATLRATDTILYIIHAHAGYKRFWVGVGRNESSAQHVCRPLGAVFA